MNGLGAFAFAGAALTGWIGLGLWRSRRNNRRLATARPGMTREAFVAALASDGVDRDVAGETFEWIADYYVKGTTPAVDDLMKDDITICAEDIEFFVADLFDRNGLPKPSCRNPEILPDHREVTPRSLALYLTRRRAELRGRKAVTA